MIVLDCVPVIGIVEADGYREIVRRRRNLKIPVVVCENTHDSLDGLNRIRIGVEALTLASYLTPTRHVY